MQLLRNRPLALACLVALIAGAAFVMACGGDDTASTTATQTTAATATAAGASSTTTGSASVEACPPSGAATGLTGAGSTFDNPLFSDWFARYKTLCNIEVNYQSIGSGGGIQQITAKTVDFGASDGIMTDAQKAAAPGPIHHIPVTSDAVAVVYNLTGIANAALTLDSTTLANIFLGKITKWDDPAIKALNSGATLPSEDITVVHRSDGSGTTFIFTNYMDKVSTDWHSAVGNASSVQWPTGIGGQGNEGVSGAVKQTEGSIGYISLAYAKQNNINYAKLKNKAGQAVEPSLDSAKAAAAGITIPANAELMITDSSNPQAYPISGFSWLLVYTTQDDKSKAETLAHVIYWMITDAQQYSTADNYVPLSDDARSVALAELADTTYNGTPITDLK